MTWCTTEELAIASDLSDLKAELANEKVLSQEQAATEDGLIQDIAKMEKEVGDIKDAMAQATALRQKQNVEYTEDLQINTQSLHQIKAAIKHVNGVGKQGGFLQNGILKKFQINR